jgi:small conductance mechanosensitive channel
MLAVLGAAGLAVGLALQGTLSNIASGIMLLWLRPFQIGDYIEVSSQSGAVEEIGLFACKLRSFDGLCLFMPNSAIWNTPLKNHTRNGGRLVSVDVSLPPATELERARTTILEAAKKVPEVLKSPEPKVFMQALTGSALVLSLMVWTAPQGAGDVERNLVERIKHAFEVFDEKLRPAQIVRTVPPDADPSRFLEKREPLPL